MHVRSVYGLFAAIIFSATITPSQAQTSVSGTVQDKNTGTPMAAVVVGVQGTRDFTTTNADGRYKLDLRMIRTSSDSVTLVARRIGFSPVTRRIALGPGADASVDFALSPAAVGLEEVVVTGTATDGPGSAPPKDRAKGIVASPAEASARDVRLSKTRADASRVGRRTGIHQEPRPGVLTAAVWDDAQHWSQYSRFLDRAKENSWNPWGLEVGENAVRPVRSIVRKPSARRALDLGFLVDATGSMGDEMTFLQSEVKDIVRRVRAVDPDLDIRLSVVFYRDRGDAFITKALPFTRSADEAVQFIAATTADGGGDYPEDMNAGLETMMRQQWSRDAVPQMLFLLADAPPHQYPGQDYTYHEAIQDAAASGVAIYPVAASGVDKPTEFLFRAMAVRTGGKYIFLTDDSGVGDSHEEPDITGYTVEKLNDLMVREIRSYVAAHTTPQRVAGTR